MAKLTIDYDAFKTDPMILFREMQKTGFDGYIIGQGLEYKVQVMIKKAANDPVYGKKKL